MYLNQATHQCDINCDSNCATCLLTTTHCLSCNVDMYLNEATNLCQSTCDSNCLTCQTTTTRCLTCNGNDYLNLSNNHCQATCDTNCLTCLVTTTRCKTCNPGMYLNKSIYNCQALCDTNCQTCFITTTNCLTCPAGTYLNELNNSCSPTCNSNCQTCQTLTTYCLTCFAGFQLDEAVNKCIIICDSNCASCLNTPTNCVSCYDGMFLNQSTKECQTDCDTNCLTCSFLTTTCSTCHDGYNLNQLNFKCDLICTDNCQTCVVDPSHCTSCFDGMYVNLSNFVCESTCDVNCLTCKNTTKNCQTCNTGMYLDNITDSAMGTCLVCHPPCAVCLQPSKVEICLDCQFRYFLDNTSACQACDPSCYKCTGITSVECSQCAPGEYLLVSGADKTCHQCISPCYDCSSDPVCLSCIPQYFLSGSTCLPCTPPCFNCITTTSTCVDCFGIDNRGVVNGECVCLPHYYDQNNGQSQCLICDSNCKNCIDLSTKCTSCDDGFYLNNNICLQCSKQCVTCENSASNCISCNSDVYLRTLWNNQCICDDGLYYSDVQLVCEFCIEPCETCLSGVDANGNNYDGNQCLSCLIGYNRIIDNTINSCICQTGFFDSGQVVCSACASYCISCLTDEMDCNVCKPSTFRDPAQKCLCQDGYFGTDLVCQPCSFPCFKCELQSNRCIACTGARVLNGNSCECDFGYYETSTKACLTCSHPCASCVALPTFCYSCVNGYYQPTGELSCLPCNIPCQNCVSNDGNKCLTCLPTYNREVLNLVCVCKVSYYQIDNTSPCLPCASTCYQCENNGDGTQCTSCKIGDNRYLNASKNCVCNSNHFEQLTSSQCMQCTPPCLSCIISQITPPADGTQCLTCQSGLNRIIDSVNKKCPCEFGYYQITGTLLCYKCQSPCLQCIDDGTGIECTTCILGSNRVVVSQSCLCQDGYYQVGSDLICSPCNYTCQKCQNLTTECHLCDPLKHRLPVGFTCICQDNYYDDMTNDQDCKPCTYPCEQCHSNTNGTKCKTCIPGLNRHFSNYKCICDDGYFENNGLCLSCHLTCKTCNSPYSCLTCDAAKYDSFTFRNGLACVCKQGFEMNSLGQCIIQCPIDCLTCNQNTCLTCNSNRVLLNGRCVCSLSDNTKFCRSSCENINFGKLASSLTSPSSNNLLDKLNENSLSPASIVMDSKLDSSISCSIKSLLEQGIISSDKTNYNRIVFKQQEILSDQSPFGDQASYFHFVKDNIRYLLFQKDATILNLKMQYNFEINVDTETILSNSVPKSSLNQQILSFNIDNAYFVVLVFTYNINSHPTISSNIINNNYELDFQFSSSSSVIMLTEFYIDSPTFASAIISQIRTISDYIGQLYWQGIAFECMPHLKNARQTFWENHQFLLQALPTNLLPLKVTDGANHIKTAFSSGKFSANSAKIQLNYLNINYQTGFIEYDNTGFSYFTVQYPEILVFGLKMLPYFIFDEFTIQHYIPSGYQINNQQLTYSSIYGEFIGYFVDLYGTTSVKTLIFSYNQGHNFNVVQNANNILISVTGTNVKEINFAIMAFDDMIMNNSYQIIFEQYIKLLISSIEQTTRTPLRFVNQYWKLNPLTITGPFEPLTESIGGYYIVKGTNVINSKFPFDQSHKISTNLKQDIMYTNGYLVNGDTAFGKLTKYFTQTDNKFILGAQLNNIQYISISMTSTDTFVSCVQSVTLYKDIYAFVSQCKRTEFQIYQVFMIDLNEYDVSIVLQQSNVEVKLSNIQKIRQLYYLMVVSKSSSNLNTNQIIQDMYQGIFKSIGYFGFDFQCLTYNEDFQCAIYRSGYKASMYNEFDSSQLLTNDVYNMNGKKCNYFNFDNAVTILKNYKVALDSLISNLIQSYILPLPQDNFYQYDALIVGKLTSSTQPNIYIDVPQQSASEVQKTTPKFFGAQSQLYQFINNAVSLTLIETRIDEIVIFNTLIPSNNGQLSVSTQFFSDYGIVFQSICYTTFDSQIFPNTYECFIRPLNPQHDQINIIVTPPLKDLTYKIQQQDNILMMYLLFADFGTVPQKSQVIQQISKQVYEQILNSVQNDQCKCWGRYRQKENNCRCQDGYYPPAETTFGLLDCTPCNYKCLTCQFTSTQCISCPLNSNRKLDLDIYSCECKEGYLELGVIVCSPCHYSCGKCETFPYKCTECNSAHHRTWDNINFLCPCDDGYYDDGSNSICVKCDHSCSKCSQAGKVCIACVTSVFRTQQADNTCPCDAGYYDDGVNSLCQPCDYTCSTCVDTATKCTGCKINSQRKLSNNECICNNHYYHVNLLWDCQQCSIYCYNCSGATRTECLDCQSIQNRELKSTSCECVVGYFKDSLDSVICPQCDYQCKTCSVMSNQCQSCEPTFNRLYDSFNKKCYCRDGYFDDGTNGQCQTCSYRCRTCVSNLDKCLSCPLNTNRKYDSTKNTCKCQSSFSDIGVPVCMKCHASCQECQTIATFCLQCNTNKTFRLDSSNINNTCPCQDGYYDDGMNTVCKLCHPQCNTCSQFQICTSCNITFGRIDKSSIDKTCPCNDGFYDDNINKQCQTCHYSCQTCIEKNNKCVTCNITGTYRSKGIDSCPCNAGYYDDGDLICKVCHFKCATCTQTSTYCTSCPQSRQGTNCDCKIGYIENGVKECTACYFKCGLCTLSDLNTCLACNLNRINLPKCDCDSGYYELNNECLPCPNKCQSCDTTATCYNCKGDRLNNPVCYCPDGYYEDEVSINCTVCFGNCATCNKDICLTCKGNRILKPLSCTCPENSINHIETPFCSDCDVAVISAQFSSDLSIVYFTFPYNVQFVSTKKFTPYSACQQIFQTSTYSTLGNSPLCSIVQENLLIVELSEQSSITVSTNIQFNTDILLKTGCSSAIINFILINFTYNPVKMDPVFELTTYSDQITLCQDIPIRIIYKFVDGKRNFTEITWSIVKMYPQTSSVSSYLTSLFAEANANNLQSITIAALALSEYGTYVIQLKAKNFRDQVYTAQTTIQTESFESPIIKIDPDQQYIFGRWQDLSFTVTLKHLSCYTNSIVEVFDAIRVNWTEVAKTPKETTSILNESKISETDGMTFLSTLRIPAYTAALSSTYTIQVTASLTNKPIKTSIQFTITIVSSPMQAYIQGGTRTQSFNDYAFLNGFCRDPDLDYPWNKDPEITFDWKCINLATSESCTDSNKEPLELNKTDSSQTFKPRVLDPYQPLQFIMRNTKNTVVLITQMILLVIENDLPNIQVSYPSGYDSRQILLHEELNFTLATSVDPDSLKYFCQIVYNYNIVASFTFKFLQVKFRIWDYWEDTEGQITAIQIKMAAKDIYHYMPSSASVNLQLNIPPNGCKFSVTPPSGISIADLFVLSVTNCFDSQLPLTYQFHIYSSQKTLDNDNLIGETINKKSITDKQSSPQLQLVLPTPINPDNSIAYELVLVASIFDNNNGMKNLTKTVKVNSIYRKIENSDFQSILLQIRRALKLSDTINESSLPSLFIGSQELSTLYNQLPQEKKLQMKKILKEIYSILLSFQGKMTSKILEESLLSSIAAIGRTGINYEIDDADVVDFYTIKQQIKQTMKQLNRQINDLDYFLQQKSKSGGSTSKFEDAIKALDNTLLNSGYVTDTLFNAIKSNSFQGADVTDSDVNMLKEQIQQINKLVAVATLKRSLANEKPRQFAGQQMGMQAYKSTPAQIQKILSGTIAPRFFGSNSNISSTTDLQGTGNNDNLNLEEEDDEINYDEYLSILNGTSSINGTNSTNSTNSTNNTNNTNNTNTMGNRRLLQFVEWIQNKHNIHYLRNLEQIDPVTVKQYEVSMSNYATSPNLNDPKFSSQLQVNQTTEVSNSSNITHDQSIVSDFGTIQPNITMTENGNSTEIKSLEGQTLKLSFQAPQNLSSNSTMECLSESKDTWQTGTCNIKKELDAQGNIVYVCDCVVVNPTTVITKLDSFISNKLSSVFNANSFDIFLQIQFWKYAIFYIAIGFTGAYVALMVLGLRKDNQDFIEEITKELNVKINSNPNLLNLKKEIHDIVIEEKSIEDSIEHQNEKLPVVQSKDFPKLALLTLNHPGNIELKQDEQGRLILPEEHNTDLDHQNIYRLQVEQNKQKINFKQVQDQLQQHQLYNPNSNKQTSKATELQNVIKNVYTVHDLKYEHGQEIKLKTLSLKVLWEGILTLHRVLSILMLYDDVISRPARFALVYAKTILVLALSALFSGNMGPVYGTMISVGIGQVINVILSIITATMKASPILKFLGILFTIAISGICWFIVLMLSASMEEIQANLWAIQFASTQIIDLIIVEFLIISIKLSIYPWAVKALHNPDESASKILANLVFIIVAQPQIQKFFEVEDKQDKEITKELNVKINSNPNLLNLKKEIHDIVIEEKSIEDSIEHQNEKLPVVQSKDFPKLALLTLNHPGNIELKQDEQGRLILPEEHNTDLDHQNIYRLQVEQNKQKINFKQVQDQLQQHQLYNPNSNKQTSKATELQNVIKNVYTVHDLKYEHGQEIKLKTLSLKVLWEGILTLHRVLSILMLYDDVISRPARFALVYAKTILVLALSALFSGNMGPVYGTMISVGIGQVINVILSIITATMKASPILKFLGILFTIAISGICWFIVLMLSASMEEIQANLWAIQFASTQIIDLIIVEFLIISIKLSIYPWAVKALHNPDESASKILANLVFIIVAQPQIQKFFEVEDKQDSILEA
ncbi:unnamed protein product [Paramecium sonneborni]|uniref:EGF-like domain-containing protein n=1 Tax=Paramecium sonneborni TaxID=65129 RepID=A0A8S1MW12_9CILI|nr:unnamed protein product [Paramecium sonneborni]